MTNQVQRKTWVLAILALPLVSLGGCVEQTSFESEVPKTVAGGGSNQQLESLSVDVMDFIRDSGLDPTFPQLWIYDRSGSLVATEKTYQFGKQLNIETGSKGPVFNESKKLESYLVSQSVSDDDWRVCGADYCVIRIIPDVSLLKHCEPCEMMQARLDEFFSLRGMKVLYRDVILTNHIAPRERLKSSD